MVSYAAPFPNLISAIVGFVAIYIAVILLNLDALLLVTCSTYSITIFVIHIKQILNAYLIFIYVNLSSYISHE